MSMTYYAVTDDPNELAHFGILGMKWGVRRTPEQLGHPRHTGSKRPKSPAYKKAQSKLGKMMKSGIKKAEANWKAYNSPKAKEERFMKKAMQQARTGTLKYGKLTDEQVRKVTDRLALERNARQLGSTENPRYAKRLKIAVGEGIVKGIGQGTASYINERFTGRGRVTAELKGNERREKYESRKDVQQRRAYNDQLKEFYKTAAEEGNDPGYWKYTTQAQRAKYLSEVKERNRLSEAKRNREEQQRRAFDNAYYANVGKNAAEYAKNQKNSDWEEQQSYPRLSAGQSSYTVTRKTPVYKEPAEPIIYVDPKGSASFNKRTGRKKGRIVYD